MASPTRTNLSRLIKGILTIKRITTVAATTEQIYDASEAARTAHAKVSNLWLYSPRGQADVVLVGGSTLDGTTFLYELVSGDPPLVIEVNVNSIKDFYIRPASGTPAVIAAQLG